MATGNRRTGKMKTCNTRTCNWRTGNRRKCSFIHSYQLYFELNWAQAITVLYINTVFKIFRYIHSYIARFFGGNLQGGNVTGGHVTGGQVTGGM